MNGERLENMKLPSIDVSEFTGLVKSKRFKEAFQSVMGVGDKPVLYGRALIELFKDLEPQDQYDLIAWCSVPMELEPLDAIRWYVDQIVRHELGHAIAAELLGFHSGKMTLQLLAANGDHVATTRVGLDIPVSSVAEVRRYVEKRTIVLMAGTMAEPDSSRNLMRDFHAAFEDGPSNSDRQKCDEFIQLLLNIESGDANGPMRQSDCYRSLVAATHELVLVNHAAMVRTAHKMSHRVQTYGERAMWTPAELQELLAQETWANPLINFSDD